MTAAISARGLSKRYFLRHDRDWVSPTLRDVLSAQLRRAVRALAGRPVPASQTASEEFWALREVSFDLAQGARLGVIGRNGAGKSTLLKLLSRITEPSEGTFELRGRAASLLEVGTGFHPELSGRENVFLNGAILGMSREQIARRLDEIVAFAGVERFVDTPLKRYSSGMYVRLAFSVAAHLEPDVLILDEVFAVGDADFQKKCLAKMNDLGREGRTLVFVSHNLGAVEQLCTEALLLEGGRLAAHSRDVAGVVHAYLSRASTCAATEWHNAGTDFPAEWFKPLRVALTGATGATLSRAARRDEQIFLEIDAEITDYDPQLRVGYAVHAETGELLYWSEYTDGPAHEWPRLSSGRILLRAELPHALLNEGSYRISLLVGFGEGEWLIHPGAGGPTVDLELRGGFDASPRWTSRRPGLIAPDVRWTRNDGTVSPVVAGTLDRGTR